MELKAQYDKLGDENGSDSDCDLCESYEEENSLMREQCDQQGLVIQKLSKAQELLMMQYKVMELGLNKELLSIQETQVQIEAMRLEAAS